MLESRKIVQFVITGKAIFDIYLLQINVWTGKIMIQIYRLYLIADTSIVKIKRERDIII